LGIPTIVLVRDPEDAVLSLSLWTPHVTLEEGLRDYVRFYRRILPYRDRFVVATFEEVSTDFGEVIRRLNERFGSSFQEFQHTEANVALCFRIIEEHDRRTAGEVVEQTVARPSQQRERMKNALRSALRSPKLARVRADAYSIYETFTFQWRDRDTPGTFKELTSQQLAAIHSLRGGVPALHLESGSPLDIDATAILNDRTVGWGGTMAIARSGRQVIRPQTAEYEVDLMREGVRV
jgi:hypothetical protein